MTEESVVDAELEESLQQLRGFVNPWTLIEQQVPSLAVVLHNATAITVAAIISRAGGQGISA